MKRNSYPIDFVVTWLDSSDPQWQEQYLQYKYGGARSESARFRNMDIFRYWFRAVERYAPWVNKVYLVTNGTFPKWINPDHPKLVLVKHSDYISEEFLPTFNSITIEFFLHKIKGLSEHFVYFNDDCFLNAPIKPEIFFRKGLPCDNNCESILNVPVYSKDDRFGIYMSILANIGVINAHFKRWDTVCQSFRRWYGIHLGLKGLFLSLFLRRQKRFVGFGWRHFEHSFLKSTFEEAWRAEPDMLRASCTRFREDITLNPYFFRYWQFATNRFYPTKLYSTKLFTLRASLMSQVESALRNPRICSVCLNDTAKCPDDEFVEIDKMLQSFLDKKFPSKSAFEI